MSLKLTRITIGPSNIMIVIIGTRHFLSVKCQVNDDKIGYIVCFSLSAFCCIYQSQCNNVCLNVVRGNYQVSDNFYACVCVYIWISICNICEMIVFVNSKNRFVRSSHDVCLWGNINQTYIFICVLMRHTHVLHQNTLQNCIKSLAAL